MGENERKGLKYGMEPEMRAEEPRKVELGPRREDKEEKG